MAKPKPIYTPHIHTQIFLSLEHTLCHLTHKTAMVKPNPIRTHPPSSLSHPNMEDFTFKALEVRLCK